MSLILGKPYIESNSQGNCIEVTPEKTMVRIRETEIPEVSFILTPEEYVELISGIKMGTYNPIRTGLGKCLMTFPNRGVQLETTIANYEVWKEGVIAGNLDLPELSS